jgi:hypothetical protein
MTIRLPLAVLGLALALPAAVSAQTSGPPAPPPAAAEDPEAEAVTARAREQIGPPVRCVPGRAANGEIVVCGRSSENDPARIPKELRNLGKDRASEGWAANAQSLDEVGRAERPGSNSPVGSGGQSGQREQMLREWRAAREAERAAKAAEPYQEPDD